MRFPDGCDVFGLFLNQVFGLIMKPTALDSQVRGHDFSGNSGGHVVSQRDCASPSGWPNDPEGLAAAPSRSR